LLSLSYGRDSASIPSHTRRWAFSVERRSDIRAVGPVGDMKTVKTHHFILAFSVGLYYLHRLHLNYVTIGMHVQSVVQ